MRSIAVIEAEKRKLLTSLDETFGTIGLRDLSVVAEVIEIFLQMNSKEVLSRHAWDICECVHHPNSAYLVHNNREYYEVVIGGSITSKATLLISLNSCSPHLPRKNKQRTFSIKGFGKYKKVRFFFPQHLRVNVDLAVGLVRGLYETGYGWIRNQIELLAQRENIALVDDLYNYLRRIFPAKELRKNLWFASITEGYGFRLIERHVAAESFELIDRHAGLYGYSTSRLVSELLSTRLPSEGLLMQIALNLNQCIDGDLSLAKYKKEGSIYAGTMEALYGRESFTIFPVRTGEKLSVFALFPTEDRSSIEPILVEHTAELSEMVVNASPRIERALKIFDRKEEKKFDLSKLVDEMLLLQPNFFGLGFDFNDVWKRWRERRGEIKD
ncbi:hypothetical protein MYX82_03890 [Acidobacteria bacterium AH-259-D05]|nr:hypothetical protein [Acidobacteria bacterium AH-259-D05]